MNIIFTGGKMKRIFFILILLLAAQIVFSDEYSTDHGDYLGYTPSEEQWTHMHQNDENNTGTQSEENEEIQPTVDLSEEQKELEEALKKAEEAKKRAEEAKEAEKRTISEAQEKADAAAKAAKDAAEAAEVAKIASDNAIAKAKEAEEVMRTDSNKYREAAELARHAKEEAEKAKQNALLAEQEAKNQQEALKLAQKEAKAAQAAAHDAELKAAEQELKAEEAKIAALVAEQESKESIEKYNNATHELEQTKLRFMTATKKDTELVNTIDQMKKDIENYKKLHEGELGIGKKANKEAKIELNKLETELKRTSVLEKEYEELRKTTALAYSEAYKKLGDVYEELNITGDPVRIATGEYICETTDFSAQDYLQKFTVERNYTQNHAAGSFGLNWTCSLDSRIIRGCYPDLSEIKKFYNLFIQKYQSVLSEINFYDEEYPEYPFLESQKLELENELQVYKNQLEYLLFTEERNAKIQNLNKYVSYGEYSEPFSCDYGENSLVFIDTLGNSYVCFSDSDNVYIPCAPLSAVEFCIYCLDENDKKVQTPVDAEKFLVQYRGGQKSYYSADGIISKFIDNHGNKTEYFSDAGLINCVKLKTDELIKISRNPNKLITNISGDVSGTAVYEYSGNLLTSVTTNDGNKIRFTYDHDNDIASIIKPDASSINISYEYYSGYNKKMISSIQNEEGQSEKFNYDFDKKLVVHENIAGQKEVFKLNEKGNTVEYQLENDASSTYEYDSNGLVITASENHDYVNYFYDENFYPVVMSYSDGSSQQYQYNQYGELIKQIDRDGFSEELFYDENHNCVQVNYCGKMVSVRDFYENGLLHSIKEKNCKNTFTYNQYGSIESCLSEYDDGTVVKSTYGYDSQNRLVKYEDGRNNTVKISYTDNSRTELLNNNTKVEYLYDKRGNLIKLTDTDLVTGVSETYNYFYDKLNRVTSIFINNQLYRKVLYAKDNQIKEFYQFDILAFDNDFFESFDNQNRKGIFAFYDYDKKLRAISELSGECTICGNDENSIITTPVSNTKISYKNDSGTITQTVTMDNFAPVEYVYNNSGLLVQVKQSNNAWEKYDYSPAGRLLKQYTNKNETVTFSQDENGKRICEIDENNNQTEYFYNLEGKLIQTKDSLGQVTDYEYDSQENLTKIKYPKFCVVYEYDSNNREKSCVLLNGKYSVVYKRSTQIDDENHKIKIVEGDKYLTEYNFDGHYNLLQNQDSLKNAFLISNNYAKNNFHLLQNTGSILNENGYVNMQQNYDTGTTVYDYDYFEQKVIQKNANGDIYKFWFDNNNNLIKEENSLGDICQYFYDETGRIKKIVDFEKNTYEYFYDANAEGNLKKIMFPNGMCQTIQTDFFDNVTKVSGPTGDYIYEYDTGGKLISAQDCLSNVAVFYDYDEKGRCIQKKSSSFDFNYEYEDNSDLIKTLSEKNSNFQVDFVYKNGLETQRSFNNGIKVETCYDDKNRKISTKTYTPYGIVSLAEFITYDDNDRITNVVDKDGNEIEYFYDEQGRLIKVSYPYSPELVEHAKAEAVECGLYIKDEWPFGSTSYIQNGTLQYCWYEEYTYTPIGNIQTVTNPFGVIVYDYDSLGRLINKHSANTLENGIKYEWSKNGNLVSAKNSHYEIEFLYENENRPKQMKVCNKLTGELQTTEYEYDVFGRRISEQQNDSDVRRYIYDGFSTDLLAETPLYNNNSAFINYSSTIVPETQEKYRFVEQKSDDVKTYKDDFTEQLNSSNSSPNIYVSIAGKTYGRLFYDSTSFLENDYEIFINQNQGDAVAGIFDKNGSFITKNSYDVWGNPLNLEQKSDNFSYSDSKNQQISQFLLYNVGYRDYSPQMKSFTSADPARFGDNWYAYCSCDPVNFTDANGFYKKGLTEAEKAYYSAGVVGCASFILSEAKETGFSAGIWNLFDCADVSTAIDRIASKSAGINDYSVAAKKFDEHCEKGDYETAKSDVSTEKILNGDAKSYRKIDCITSLADLVKTDLLTPGSVLLWKNDHSDPEYDNWVGHALTIVSVEYDEKGKPIGAVYMEGHSGGEQTEVGYMKFRDSEQNKGFLYYVNAWRGEFVGIYELEKETGFRENCLK